MFCPNCGANIPEDSSLCPECGTEIIVARNPGNIDHDLFIVAEDVCEVNTPFGPVVPVLDDDREISRSGIIEAEEEIPEVEEDAPFGASVKDTDVHIPPEGYNRSVRYGVDQDRTNDTHVISTSDGKETGTEMESGSDTYENIIGDVPSSDPLSSVRERNEASGGAKMKENVSEPYSYTDYPPPSRKRSAIVALAVIILVVLGFSILLYGLPGQEPVKAGVSVPTPLPTVLPAVTTVPVPDTPPPWTPSEDLSLSISAYDGGYKAEIDGGLKANEVAKIVLTIEDVGGIHSMEWAYPSRRESFFMAREAYNGTASAIEHVTATATFTDGKKVVVFSGDL